MPSDNGNVMTLPMSLEQYVLQHIPVRVLGRRYLVGVICYVHDRKHETAKTEREEEENYA